MLNRYLGQIEPGDPTNREGQAARISFNQLFGKDFVRGGKDDVNAMLNYGYAILLSTFNRAISGYGYNTVLGIHHCNRFNPYNLSSDLMEPFRPFVDLTVYLMRGKQMNREVKKALVSVSYRQMIFGGETMELQSAIDRYVPLVFRNIGKECFEIPLLEFADEG